MISGKLWSPYLSGLVPNVTYDDVMDQEPKKIPKWASKPIAQLYDIGSVALKKPLGLGIKFLLVETFLMCVRPSVQSPALDK